MELLCGYEILDEVASGGFADVYRVRECEPPYREFAAKRFRKYSDQAVFEQEVLSLHAIRGLPNTQQFFRAIQQKNHLIILTEYIDGTPLKALVVENGPLPETEALKICQSVTQILLSLEKIGIRHLDIKPSNILINDQQITLTDFGIAEASNSPRSEVTKTDFSYTAPEKYFGYHTDRSDVYSLGVTLYFLVTGNLPFGIHKKSNAYKLLCHCIQKPEYPAALSPVMKQLLERLLDKESNQRPSLTQLADAIDNTLRQNPNLSPLPTTPLTESTTPEEAESFALAAKQGIPFAQYRHALNLEEKNLTDEALQWYTKAAHAGFARAQNNLGLHHSENNEPELARQWYEKAASADNAFSQYNLAKLYDGSNEAYEENKTLHMHWLKRAADNGHERAQNLLAIHYEDNNNPHLAFKYYLKAAYSGFKAAQYNLGRLYENDVIQERIGSDHMENAYFWYKEASKLHHAKAAARLKILNRRPR